jgi:hypothetical protein
MKEKNYEFRIPIGAKSTHTFIAINGAKPKIEASIPVEKKIAKSGQSEKTKSVIL